MKKIVRKPSWALCLLMSALMTTAGGIAEPAPQTTARDSAAGKWQTVDDVTGKAKSIVMIWEENGKLVGRIQKLIDPPVQNPVCRDCSGDQKNKPVVGLRILWDMQKDKDGWSGGTILDPETGKSYKCLMSLMDNGHKLKVRGFIGLALIGRTQYWNRE